MINNTDINKLLKEAIEAKPKFVEPPPLLRIGRPVLGYKPKSRANRSNYYKKFNIILLLIFSICIFLFGLVIGMKLL